MDSAGAPVSLSREMQETYNQAKAVKTHRDSSSGPVAVTGSARGPHTHTINAGPYQTWQERLFLSQSLHSAFY